MSLTSITQRIRQRGLATLQAVSPGPIILAYHRICEVPQDPQSLAVRPSHFEEQLHVLSDYGPVLSLAEAETAAQRGHVPRRASVITFDDGYSDNFLIADPILQKFETRATVFVSTDYTLSGKEFWWDEVERLLLHTGPLPEIVELRVENRVLRFETGSELERNSPSETENRRWCVNDNPAPSRRHAAYRDVCSTLRPLSHRLRDRALEKPRTSLQVVASTRTSHRPMTASEVSELAGDPLIEIGSHSHHHAQLSGLSASEQAVEIGEGKRQLEEIVNRSVESFSYPYGLTSSYTSSTMNIVRDLGFKRACANFPGRVSRWSSPFELPRFLVRDWDGDEFTRRLSDWSRRRP